MKYQDRIMYGTDMGVSEGMTDRERVQGKARIKERNLQFATYLATDEEIPFGDLLRGDKPVGDPEYYVTGLALPPSVLKKVYYDNVLKWFPGAEEGYKDQRLLSPKDDSKANNKTATDESVRETGA